MKSIRDLVHKMPETKKGLEDYVLENSPTIKEAVERNPQYRKTLEKVVGDTFDEYHKYIGGVAQKIAAAGRGVGYTADAWLATGDVVGSLGGKFIHLLAQIPEKAYGLVYAARTGNYLDGLRNVFEGIVSYIPGFTVADEGLSRIVQKRMAKEATRKMEKEIGAQSSWYAKTAETARGNGYKDVQVRKKNIIGPSREYKLAA